MELLVERIGAGADTLKARHALRALLDGKFLHGSKLLFIFFIMFHYTNFVVKNQPRFLFFSVSFALSLYFQTPRVIAPRKKRILSLCKTKIIQEVFP